MPRNFTKLCLIASLLTQSILPSHATTYDPVEYIHPSSWYAEIFGGVNALRGTALRHNTFTHPQADNPFTDSFLQPGFVIGPAAGAAFGFRYSHNMRIDGQYTYTQNKSREFCGKLIDSAAEEFDVSGDDLIIRSHLLMMNTYFDFFTPSVNFNPYIGLGLGVAIMKSSHYNLTATSPIIDANDDDEIDGDDADISTTVNVPENRADSRLAGQVTLGFNYPFNNQSWLDFRYRYASTLSSTRFFRQRAQHHIFTLGLQGYLSPDNIGKLSPEYDPVTGYQRSWFLTGFAGVTALNNNDFPLEAGIAPLSASFRPGYDFGGALGFYINPETRLDLQLTHAYSKTKRSCLSFVDDDVDVNITGNTWINTTAVMINGNHEFKNIADRHVPYLGVGAGIARLRQARIAITGVADGEIAMSEVPAQTTTRFAYQLNAGVISQRSERLFLDFSYRYFNTGKVVFLSKRLENHMFNIGLTYLLADPSEGLA